ncbi:MFS transporter [Dickeya fangzhongdai]|uniref:MFS transporter n=1 Tax=Dickeya fangzhongdai TaxID=1778540 RepID=UPI0026DF3DC2|nr:MFS transporter [Dickeya fangzhongdai]WKV51711.1 MFS transporter [Dickeya fangzhongdai]
MQLSKESANSSANDMSLWMAIIMLSIGSFIFINTEFLPIGLLSDIASYYSISSGQAGLMVTVPGVAAAIAAPILTRYCGAKNRRYILLAMTMLLVISNLTMAFSNSFALSLFCRLLLGIGVGGFWSFAVPFGVNIVKEHHKSRATTIITAGVAAGTVAGVPIGTFLGVHFGWQNAFLVNGILSAVVLILQFIFLPSLKGESSLTFPDMVRVILEKSVSKRLLSTMFFAAAHFCSFTYFELILTKEASLSQSLLPGMFLLYGCTGFIGTFISEYFVKKISAKNTFRLSTVLLFTAIMLMPLSSAGYPAVIALTMLWGLSYGLMPVSINIWLYEANEKDYVTSTASNVCVYQIAVAVGSFVGGMAFNAYGVFATLLTSVSIGILCFFISFINTPR